MHEETICFYKDCPILGKTLKNQVDCIRRFLNLLNTQMRIEVRLIQNHHSDVIALLTSVVLKTQTSIIPWIQETADKQKALERITVTINGYPCRLGL